MTLSRLLAATCAACLSFVLTFDVYAYSADSFTDATPTAADSDVRQRARLKSRARRTRQAAGTVRQTANQRNRTPRRLVQSRALRRQTTGERGTLRRTRRSTETMRRTAEVDQNSTRRYRRARQAQLATGRDRTQSKNLRRKRVELKRRTFGSDNSATE